MENILITGGTGSIGRKLTGMLLEKNYKVIIFTRDPNKHPESEDCTYAYWNPKKQEYDKEAFEKADHIIHLAGAGIADKRWTKKRKSVIYNSRIAGDDLIVKGLRETQNKIQSVISASAIGYYPEDEGGAAFTEENKPGKGFMASVCQDWEAHILPVKEYDKRLVIIRTGVVLDKESGAYREFSKPLQFRAATVLGNGKQIVSWVHMRDLCRAYIFAIENKHLNGVYNVCAPGTVSNEKLVTEIATQRFDSLFVKVKVPAFLLKLALGQLADEALLKSITVSPQKIIEAGFIFQFPEIEAAVDDLENNAG